MERRPATIDFNSLTAALIILRSPYNKVIIIQLTTMGLDRLDSVTLWVVTLITSSIIRYHRCQRLLELVTLVIAFNKEYFADLLRDVVSDRICFLLDFYTSIDIWISCPASFCLGSSKFRDFVESRVALVQISSVQDWRWTSPIGTCARLLLFMFVS